MLWDAWIRKVPNKGHELALSELGRQLGNYARGMNYKLDPKITAAGGHEEIDEVTLEDGDVHPERRVDPDKAMRVALEAGESEPRIVIEVELSNRDPLPLAKHVHGLMLGWPNLRSRSVCKSIQETNPLKLTCILYCIVLMKSRPRTLSEVTTPLHMHVPRPAAYAKSLLCYDSSQAVATLFVWLLDHYS
jgi:hypothetical protein